jgi:hypothetical protein
MAKSPGNEVKVSRRKAASFRQGSTTKVRHADNLALNNQETPAARLALELREALRARPRAFTDRQIELAMLFADQAANRGFGRAAQRVCRRDDRRYFRA